MRDLNNLPGVDFLDYADRIRFILLNSEINNSGALTAPTDILEWNRLVDVLQQNGVMEYEKLEIGDEQSDGLTG